MIYVKTVSALWIKKEGNISCMHKAQQDSLQI